MEIDKLHKSLASKIDLITLDSQTLKEVYVKSNFTYPIDYLSFLEVVFFMEKDIKLKNLRDSGL